MSFTAMRGNRKIFLFFLIASKWFHVFSIFLAYDSLIKFSSSGVINFLIIHQFVAAAIFNIFQKPLSGKLVTKNQWLYILRHAFFLSAFQLLLLFGLFLCGPLRALLVYEHCDLVVLSVVTSLMNGYKYKNSTKKKGSILFAAAVVFLLLFDKDVGPEEKSSNHPEEDHNNILIRGIYFIFSWLGVSDHKGGVILLLLTLFLSTAFKMKAKRLSFDLGGSKRLQALSTTMSALCLLLFTLLLSLSNILTLPPTDLQLSISAIMTAISFVLEYYVESLSLSRLDASDVASYGFFTTITAALFFTSFWNTILPIDQTLLTNKPVAEHKISGGVFLSILFFYMATKYLITPIKKHQWLKGSLVGYNEEGLPIFTNSSTNQQTASSFSTFVKTTFIQIFMEQDSRQIFYFLCFNLAFTVIELIFGVWTNSLGLISDGFHMLFDCTALVMGLFAAIMSKWGPTAVYSFGFGRVEVLSGFVNSLFLVVISFFVFATAVFRLFDPPEIKTEKLLVVSFGGLLVNLFGIFTFRHHHGHSQSGHNHNANLEGVFLHVVADTLGSLGVIVSSFLVDQFDLFVADPVCSIFISILIFFSIIPLLKRSSLILLQYTDPQLENIVSQSCNNLLSIEGVKSYNKLHIWIFNTGAIVGTVHVQISSESKEQKIISQSQNIFRKNFSVFTIQIEKEEFFHHLNGLSKNHRVTSNSDKLSGIIDKSKNFIHPI